MQASIQLLPAHQIDSKKWDTCVDKNENGLIYSQTRFLNAMADNWHGLIIGEYETVMPIPWRKNGESDMPMFLLLCNSKDLPVN